MLQTGQTEFLHDSRRPLPPRGLWGALLSHQLSWQGTSVRSAHLRSPTSRLVGRHGLAVALAAVILALTTTPVFPPAQADSGAQYKLAVDWPTDITEGITVRPTLTQQGRVVRTPVEWTLKTYQVVNGEILARRIIDRKKTPGGTVTLRTQPPISGEVSGYYFVVADTGTNKWGRVTVTAKAMYRCDAPDSCTLRKVFPVKVVFHRGP